MSTSGQDDKILPPPPLHRANPPRVELLKDLEVCDTNDLNPCSLSRLRLLLLLPRLDPWRSLHPRLIQTPSLLLDLALQDRPESLSNLFLLLPISPVPALIEEHNRHPQLYLLRHLLCRMSDQLQIRPLDSHLRNETNEKLPCYLLRSLYPVRPLPESHLTHTVVPPLPLQFSILHLLARLPSRLPPPLECPLLPLYLLILPLVDRLLHLACQQRRRTRQA